MNKIYNNLTIENLKKTEWFNQFDYSQKQEIENGLEDNLDIFKYADLKFSGLQMQQLRMGLEDNLDISFYANPKFDWFQM